MDFKLIVVEVILCIAAAGGIFAFTRMPKEKRISNIKEWLKYAVVEAEKALGSGTGQIKLRMVYDMAVKQFSWLTDLVPFETFSAWVDEALVWMNQQLEENKAAQEYVEAK